MSIKFLLSAFTALFYIYLVGVINSQICVIKTVRYTNKDRDR